MLGVRSADGYAVQGGAHKLFHHRYPGAAATAARTIPLPLLCLIMISAGFAVLIQVLTAHSCGR